MSSGGFSSAVQAAARGEGLLTGELLELVAAHYSLLLGAPSESFFQKSFLYNRT
jgi:hypothetical protein